MVFAIYCIVSGLIFTPVSIIYFLKKLWKGGHLRVRKSKDSL